jgi:hypothetical protein
MSALFVFALGAFLLDVVKRTRLLAIVAHERGLRLEGTRRAVIPWDDVTAVEFRAHTRKRPRGGVFMPLPGFVIVTHTTENERYWSCRLLSGKSVLLEFADEHEDSEALVDLVRQQIAAREVPRALEALRQGESVSFGPCELSPAGLRVDRDIAWSDVADLRIEDTHLVVAGRDDELARVSVERVPNPFVLVEVASEWRARPAIVA